MDKSRRKELVGAYNEVKPPKGEVYGGWEGDTIAGHTLGHYLSALAKMHAQTRDAALRQRIDYIVAELARAQAKDADGYVLFFGRPRNTAA